jgi:hypothetical protein
MKPNLKNNIDNINIEMKNAKTFIELINNIKPYFENIYYSYKFIFHMFGVLGF